jgi:hypothetical protein
MGKRCDPLFSHVKANHGRERDPVCVLAVNIAAVNQINVEVVDRTPAQPDLEARLGYANGILPSAELAEDFGGQRPDIVRRAPVHARAISRIVLPGDAIPFPAGVEIDPQHIRFDNRNVAGTVANIATVCWLVRS